LMNITHIIYYIYNLYMNVVIYPLKTWISTICCGWTNITIIEMMGRIVVVMNNRPPPLKQFPSPEIARNRCMQPESHLRNSSQLHLKPPFIGAMFIYTRV
jgi:hypothetical protein